MTRRLHRFKGGIHPEPHKDISTEQPIGVAPLPPRLIIPLQQHMGRRAKPLVSVGQHVLKGEMLGAPDGNVSSATHAPTSGWVRDIAMHAVPHPSGLDDLCIFLEADGEDRWVELEPIDLASTAPDALGQRIRNAGIVGLGGAVFPSDIKLRANKPVGMLIINGAECEPWITCDDRLMRDRADQIVAGSAVLQQLLGAAHTVVAIEDNKPEAAAAMRAAAGSRMEVVVVPTIYPTGGAKQLIEVLTGEQVPKGGRATDLGVQCFNVATVVSVHRLVAFGEPVVSRIITVTGNVRRPQNFEVLLGTPLDHVVRLAGSPRDDTQGYVMGGPMMGFPLRSMQVPVVKATNCIIATSPQLFPPAPPPMPCIRCAKCAEACPAELQPQELYWFARAKNFEKARDYALFDCIECGCCNYVCPSHIPLVDYYRFAKSEILALDQEHAAAQLARERHETRLQRIEQEKAERAARLAQKQAAAAQSADAGDKRAEILAAVERARAKKAALQEAETSGDAQT